LLINDYYLSMQVAKSILIGISGIMLVLASEICGQTCLSVFLPDQIHTDMSAEAQQSSHHGSHSSRDSMTSEYSSNQDSNHHSDDSNGSNHCDTTDSQESSSPDHCDGSDCAMGCEMWVKSEESIALFIDAFTLERDLSDSVILFTVEDTQDPQWITPPLRLKWF